MALPAWPEQRWCTVTYGVCALYALGLVLLLMDFGQTLDIAEEPARWSELWNWFLGTHPSVSRVITYYVAWLWVYGSAAAVLWAYHRAYALLIVALLMVGIEGACVIKNYRAGIKP